MKLTALICLFPAAALLAGDESTPVTKETALTFYRGFTRLTKKPHQVAPLTATLCTFPSPELIEREKRADCHAEAKSADYVFIARKKLTY